MGKGGDSTTTVQKADPWGPAQPFLSSALATANRRFKSGDFAPYVPQGQTVAGFSGPTREAMGMITDEARGGAPMVDSAQRSLSGLLGGDKRLNTLGNYGDSTLRGMMNGGAVYRDLDAVKEDALADALPAAGAMFSGSGMLGSTQAMDTVGRAATDAVAPIEYAAWQAAQNRALQAAGMNAGIRMSAIGQNAQQKLSAAGMVPEMTAAGYLPGQMLGQVGAQHDRLRQATLDSRHAVNAAREGADAAEFERYLAAIMGIGGMGGNTSATGPSGEPSMGARLGGAGLTGLGTYGALAAIPATAPFALPAAALAGLMGLF